MTETVPTGAPTRRLAVVAALFGFVAVVVSQSIPEGGVNSWTSLPAWAAFAAVASLATLAPWIPALSAAARGSAWRAAATGAASLWLIWVLFVLPSIHRDVAFLFTVGIAASSWAVWSAPGRSPPAS